MTWGNVIALIPSVLAVGFSVGAVYYARRAIRAQKQAEAWAEESRRHLAEIRRLTGPSCPTCGASVALAVAGDLGGPFTSPSGHEVRRAEDGTFVFDHCPNLITCSEQDTPPDQAS